MEVPKTYAELRVLLGGFVPFAISFTLLLTIWYSHFRFFRRFGLHDTLTIVINAALLFVVLFYVYPLKFLFTASFSDGGAFSSPIEIRQLMAIYGFGYAAIFVLMASLYLNAWRLRDTLDLNSLERVLTQNWIVDAFGVASVGFLSVLIAYLVPPANAGMAGYTFILIGVFKTVHGQIAGRRQRKAASQLHHLQALARTSHRSKKPSPQISDFAGF